MIRYVAKGDKGVVLCFSAPARDHEKEKPGDLKETTKSSFGKTLLKKPRVLLRLTVLLQVKLGATPEPLPIW